MKKLLRLVLVERWCALDHVQSATIGSILPFPAVATLSLRVRLAP